MSIFEKTAPVLWQHGLPAIPLRGKRPFTVGWNAYCTAFPDNTVRDSWLTSHPDANVGLPLGPASAICMLDIDTDDELIRKAITDVLPPSPWARIGKKGMALAYRWSGHRNFKLASDGGMVCELLGAGNQLVLPPSIHPETGRPYVANANLWEVLDDLQELPVDVEAQLRRALSDAGVSLTGAGPGRCSPRALTHSGPAMQSRFHYWLLKRLDEAKAELGKTTEGDRNNTLLRVASKLARHVAAAKEDWSLYAAELTTVAIEIGLEHCEIPGTLESSWRYGTEDPTLWIRLAQEWVYVSGVDRFRHLATGDSLTQQAFRTEFRSASPDPDVSITTFLTANDYIEIVQNVVFDPPNPFGIIEDNGRKWLNTYRPSEVVAVKGDATPFKEFVEFLVPDERERDHLLKMFAHLARKPGEKLAHALILGSKQHGVGKSTLVDILFELVGVHNCRKASSEEMESQYNAYVENTLLVLVEEINLGAGGRKVYNKLKDVITSETTPMRRLYQDTREVRNAASFIFLTNLERPLLLEKHDRRYFVLNSPAEPRDPDYYTAFNKWWRANLGVIRHFLDQIDTEGFNRSAPPPMTAAKAELIKSSETPVVQELREMIGERYGPFRVDIVTYQQVAEAVQRRLRNVTRNMIEDGLRDIEALSLGQHRLGKVTTIPLRVLGEANRPSLWAIRNQGYWKLASKEQRVQEYLAEDGYLADFPTLPGGIEYAPGGLQTPMPESVGHGGEPWVLELVRSLNERHKELAA